MEFCLASLIPSTSFHLHTERYTQQHDLLYSFHLTSLLFFKVQILLILPNIFFSFFFYLSILLPNFCGALLFFRIGTLHMRFTTRAEPFPGFHVWPRLMFRLRLLSFCRAFCRCRQFARRLCRGTKCFAETLTLLSSKNKQSFLSKISSLRDNSFPALSKRRIVLAFNSLVSCILCAKFDLGRQCLMHTATYMHSM